MRRTLVSILLVVSCWLTFVSSTNANGNMNPIGSSNNNNILYPADMNSHVQSLFGHKSLMDDGGMGGGAVATAMDDGGGRGLELGDTIGKRAERYAFGLGRRAYTYSSGGPGKRLPVYNFGLGKRAGYPKSQYRQYFERPNGMENDYGDNDRNDLVSIYDSMDDGYEKRARPYSFGLGKRQPDDKRYNFGLGKR